MTKKEKIKSHYIFILAISLADELSEVQNLSPEAKELLELLDKIIDKMYAKNKKLSEETYVQSIQRKFETVMRKEYKSM